ncbi:hypothetical protein [Owenweeksia hongkongensis]|uniref:hypothetical protein n=1 Tax=Owenweeksia hongkongensis TaxID=253245 RepID=UPI003A91A5B9
MTGSEFDGVPYGYDNPLELSMGYGEYFGIHAFSTKFCTFHCPSAWEAPRLRKLILIPKSPNHLVSIYPRVGFDFNISKSAVVSLFAGYQLIKTTDDFSDN